MLEYVTLSSSRAPWRGKLVKNTWDISSFVRLLGSSKIQWRKYILRKSV
jgi:hypothetical protein